MRIARRILPLAAAATAVLGAKANDAAGFLIFLIAAGLAVALLVALGLPFGILLHAHRREFVAAVSRAIENRATACVVSGAGLAVAALFLLGLLADRRPVPAIMVAAAATAWFFAGFAGCARRHGERMLDTPSGDATLRPLVLGWIARAGLFAVPVAWPFVGAYLVVAAFGAPLVAMFDRRSPPS